MTKEQFNQWFNSGRGLPVVYRGTLDSEPVFKDGSARKSAVDLLGGACPYCKAPLERVDVPELVEALRCAACSFKLAVGISGFWQIAIDKDAYERCMESKR